MLFQRLDDNLLVLAVANLDIEAADITFDDGQVRLIELVHCCKWDRLTASRTFDDGEEAEHSI